MCVWCVCLLENACMQQKSIAYQCSQIVHIIPLFIAQFESSFFDLIWKKYFHLVHFRQIFGDIQRKYFVFKWPYFLVKLHFFIKSSITKKIPRFIERIRELFYQYSLIYKPRRKIQKPILNVYRIFKKYSIKWFRVCIINFPL